MKFKTIQDDNIIFSEKIIYNRNEYSLDTQPVLNESNYTILINSLNLTVNEHNIITQVWGFCPHTSWIESDIIVPKSSKGKVLVLGELDSGFSYRLNIDKEWKSFFNKRTGWLCIGDPNYSEKTIEFLNKSKIVTKGEDLVALWLKPENI